MSSNECNCTKQTTASTQEASIRMNKMNMLYNEKSNELKELIKKYALLKHKLEINKNNLTKKREKYERTKNENYLMKTLFCKQIMNKSE